MTVDTEKMKALALAAEDWTPPEPWEEDRNYSDREIRGLEFCAEANPASVLELIAEVERLRAEVREWLCIDCNTVYSGPPQTGFACVMCPKCNGRTMPRLRAEVEKLKAELTTRCRAEGGEPDEAIDAAIGASTKAGKESQGADK